MPDMFIPKTDAFVATFSKEGLYDSLKDVVEYYYNRVLDDEVPEPCRKKLVISEEISDEVYQWVADREYDLGVNLQGLQEGEEKYADTWFDHTIDVWEYLSDRDLLLEPNTEI